MAIYPTEHDLPDPPRRRAAARAGFFDSRISMMAFLKTHPLPDDFELDLSLSEQYLIPEGSPAERKAQADEIAARLGAATEWHNGYYMARLSVKIYSVKIYFYPPIFLANVGGNDAEEAA